jgi:hypothetical protein
MNQADPPMPPAKSSLTDPLSQRGSSCFPQILTFFRPSLPPFPVPRPANDANGATCGKQIPENNPSKA